MEAEPKLSLLEILMYPSPFTSASEKPETSLLAIAKLSTPLAPGTDPIPHHLHMRQC